MRCHLNLAAPAALTILTALKGLKGLAGRATMVLLLLALSGCLEINLSALDIKSKLPKLKLGSSLNHSFVAAQFKETCLSAKGNILNLRDALPAHGWTDADDIQLVEGELKRLRKIILRIPGGGGHFSQTQTIHFKEVNGRIYFLNLEERFTSKVKSGTFCALYSEASDYLETCSDVGRFLKKAPDRNEKYPMGGAQFIGWKTTYAGKRARVSCERTTKAGTLPYSGTVISLSVENDR